MTISSNSMSISSREFVAMIRSRLDATGHADVAVERRWIDTDNPDQPFLLNVPVASDLYVPLAPESDIHNMRGAKDIERHAAYFATALVTLKQAAGKLARYAENVRRAARKAIDAARADGVDLLLDGIGFQPTRAWDLSSAPWEKSYDFVQASVRVRSTSFHLQSETQEIRVYEPESVADELNTIIEEQRERQVRMAEMEALGADLEVDAITLELLEAHGFDPAQVLHDIWKRQSVALPVYPEREDEHFSLISCKGKVEVSLFMAEAFWNGSHLWFREGHVRTGLGSLVGSPLGDRVSHPVFAARPVVAVDVREEGRAELIHFDPSDKLLFDGETRRIWRNERLAA